MNDPWFRCAIKGCPTRNVPQHVLPPMTGREAWRRHYAATHLGRA